MTNQDNGSWAVILILILIFLVPIGWILVFSTAEPYHVVSGEPLRDAAQAAGITVVSATDSTWPVPVQPGEKPIPCQTKTGIFTPFRASRLTVPRPGMLPSSSTTHNRLGGAGLLGN